MRPFLFLPFVREALEKKFEEDAFIDVYATNTHLVARAGGHRLKIVVKTAPEGKLSGHLLLHLLSRGYGVFVVHPEHLEGLLILYTKPLPFSRTPDVLTWETLNLAAASKVYLSAYVLEGGEL